MTPMAEVTTNANDAPMTRASSPFSSAHHWH